MKRTLVIGDIHGGFKALLQVFKRANVTTNDTLIFLGDYVDGWSESAQLIEFLIDLDKKQKCIFIKGNHDVWCHEWLLNLYIGNYGIWYKNGGKETIASYNSQEFDTEKHLQFFDQLINYYVDKENRLFIHAGFSSMKGPENEVYLTNYRWDRTLWEMAIVMDKRVKKDSAFYPNRLKLYNEIYIGHTPTLHYETIVPMQGINVWNIDTGAAFTGKLSVLDIDTKEFWQSDSLPSLYPNEKGRN
ncbi:metallophosphoesterase family protein [Aquimarina algicola]|uniref:Serine/threonine protein phosphatase n=1 Tax=Aquimarina algicola TaxID=2589995 RepID=A0A504JDM6_9FLAO|nr:metallophosphoesterase family protein [Aquimarina algicola]TPN88927.1 serine/threonine protein phosphatase [Aquimarina algicola]